MKSPGFDDLIFKGLNRDYGAYYLRKRYNSVLTIAIVVSFVISIFIVLVPFWLRPIHPKERSVESVYVSMEALKPPKEKVTFTVQPPPPPPARGNSIATYKVRAERYVAPKVVDTIVPEVKTEIRKQVSFADSSVAGNSTGNESFGTESGIGKGYGVVGGTGEGEWYSVADVMPSFKGGDIEKFTQWVMKKTKYPEEAMENNIHGKVFVSFIVEKDGKVSTVKIEKGVDPIIDAEAKKSVQSSPKWQPGIKDGIIVRVKYIITLDFQL